MYQKIWWCQGAKKQRHSLLCYLLLGCLPLSSCITNPGNVKKNRVTRWSNHPKKRYWKKNPAITFDIWSMYFRWVWRFPPKTSGFVWSAADPNLNLHICHYFNRKKKTHLPGRVSFQKSMLYDVMACHACLPEIHPDSWFFANFRKCLSPKCLRNSCNWLVAMLLQDWSGIFRHHLLGSHIMAP